MPRVNVYLPQDLADEVSRAELNLSAVVQAALRQELAAQRTNTWLDEVRRLPKIEIDDDVLTAALQGAKDDLDRQW